MPASSSILRLAPALFVFLWSSGWLAARFAMPYADPLTFLVVRFALAAATLTVIAMAMKAPWPDTAAGIAHALFAGVMLNALYLAGVWWSVAHGLPVAISGLISALQPILTAMLAPVLLGEVIGRRQWNGIALGFVGILLVLAPTLAAVPPERLGAALLPLGVNTTGMIAITLGTFYQKRFVTGGHVATTTVLQSVGAGMVLLPAAWLLEPMRLEWNLTTVLTMAWSAIGISIGAIVLLLLLIRNGAVSRAAALIYLMPPLVAFEAFVLFGEQLTPIQVAGMVVTAIGVALAVRNV